MMLFRATIQAKEGEAIPLHAGYMAGYGAQGFIHALLTAEPSFQHLHRYGLASELAAQRLPRGGQARIAKLLSSRVCQLFQERLWSPNSQVGLFGQNRGPQTGPLGQSAFGVGL